MTRWYDKEKIVNEVYNLLGIDQNGEVYSGWGHFIWKLKREELLELKKSIRNKYWKKII